MLWRQLRVRVRDRGQGRRRQWGINEQKSGLVSGWVPPGTRGQGWEQEEGWGEVCLLAVEQPAEAEAGARHHDIEMFIPITNSVQSHIHPPSHRTRLILRPTRLTPYPIPIYRVYHRQQRG